MTQAICITNMHGRILEANASFCKLFGFRSDEIQWRYMVDLYRHAEQWPQVLRNLESAAAIHMPQLRLRHRKGRSFLCEVEGKVFEMSNGQVALRMEITRQAVSDAVVPLEVRTTVPGALVYLTVCHGCGKVQDAQGKWITPASPVHRTRHRKPCYCKDCSHQMFPDLRMAGAEG